MSANELKESLQALAWVELSGELGLLTEGGIRLRSQCGFLQRVIASESPKDFGLLIFLLEQIHSRRTSTLIVSPAGTTDAGGNSYPQLVNSGGQLETPARAPIVQPIMLEWLGPDLSNPDWLPFGAEVLPSNVDPDLFDAIAVMVPANGTGQTLAGDFSLALYKAPALPEGATAQVEPVMLFPPESLVFSGTSLTAGVVVTWPDTGTPPPFDAVQPDPAQRYEAAVGLNGLLTARSPSFGRSMTAEMRPSRNVTVALVAVWLSSTETQVNLSNDDFDYCSVVAFSGGLQFWAGQLDVLTVPLASGDVVSGVCSYAADGTWEVSYQINWGGVITAAGTANPPSLALGHLDSLQVRVFPQPNIGQLAHWQAQNKVLTTAERAALLASLAATWQP